MTPVIRLATPGDAAGICAIYAPIVRDTAISFELAPPSVEEMQARVATTLEEYPWLVCADGRMVAGYAYASRHRTRAAYQWAADVSVYVSESHHRRGVARALYAALLPILRFQGYWQACGGISLPNDASVALHESLGFEPVGIYRSIGFKLGAWHDVGWWQLALADAGGPPAPPRALSLLLGDERVRELLLEATAQLR